VVEIAATLVILTVVGGGAVVFAPLTNPAQPASTIGANANKSKKMG
jgi:hypothetical protein